MVKFYGRLISADDLMQQKLRFAQRWPSRTYVIRPGSAVANCTDSQRCTVTGVVDWQAANEAAGRRSIGVASFAIGIKDGMIDTETGSVLSRQ
jgi:hypothetical protein